MTAKITELPYFVRKQANLATGRLVDALSPRRIITEVHGVRILLKELKPHPTKAELIKTPFALLDYTEQGWLLLFRGSQGAWQRLPDDEASISIEHKIDAILSDDYKLFWRQ